MTTPCLYSIVRYSPYPETEEFANVGVVVCAPKENFFDFMITNRNDSRVRRFFHDDCIFPIAKDAFFRELGFAKNTALEISGAQTFSQFFHYFTARRESIFHFSQARVVLSNNPREEMKKIYDRYVNHSDYTKARREEVLAKELKTSIDRIDALKNMFRNQTINGTLAKFSMPLVAKKSDVISRAIKPLAFEQSEPGKMMEHGDTWVMRVTRAAEEKLLEVKDVLFTIEEPLSPTLAQVKVLDSIKLNLDKHKIAHVPASDHRAAIEFASNIIVDRS